MDKKSNFVSAVRSLTMVVMSVLLSFHVFSQSNTTFSKAEMEEKVRDLSGIK